MEGITADTFNFLTALDQNNNRDWFNENKKTFKTIEANVKGFYNSLGERMQAHDQIERIKVFRIYRDVRFSADKSPYKTHFAGSFARMGSKLRGGYYVQIKPGQSMVAAGFFNPNKEDLLRIRKEWELDASELKEILANPEFKRVWGDLQGEGVKTAPKGFDKTHPDIDLIRKKHFLFSRNFTDDEVLSVDFADQVNASFKAIRPFFDLMSAILTTDLNGEPLV